MQSSLECLRCAIDGTFRMLENVSGSEEQKEKIIKQILKHLSTLNMTTPPVETSMYIHRIIKEAFNIDDIYKTTKQNANLEMKKLMKTALTNADFENKYENFFKLLQYSVSGNIIDFGPRGHKIDFSSALNKVQTQGFAIDNTKKLYEEIKNAKTITILLDNAGEAVVDTYLMKFIKQNFNAKLTAVVREKPVLNDISLLDIKEIELEKFADKVIGNGSDAPGTLLSEINQETKEALKADVVISKGQGNFESLVNQNAGNIYFIFMMKCKIVERMIKNAKKGDFLVYNKKFKI